MPENGRDDMSHSKVQEIYPDPKSELRVPIVIVVNDDASADEWCEAHTRDWAMGTNRPVVILRANEAQQLSAQITAGLWRIEQVA
jgi:hypothetical protein